MHIEAIDLFYLALPRIERTADGTQDSLRVRVAADDGTVGWGECDASPLVSLAAYVMPDSHANIVNIRESLLGQPIDGPDDVRRAHARAMRMALDVEQIDHALAGADIALRDLVGRALGEPVWRVLGHEHSHPKLPYASVLFGEDPAATEREAGRLRGEGFRAAKFGSGRGEKGTFEDAAGSSPLVTGLTRPGGVFRDADGLVRATDASGLGVDVNTGTVRDHLLAVRITVDGEVLVRTS